MKGELSKIKLYVIIPTHGRGTLLERTLRSLSECTFPKNYIKTIVIENGPKENAELICKEFNHISCEYYHYKVANKSEALNYALTKIPDDTFIVFFDDDIRLSTNVIQAYAESIELNGAEYYYGGPFEVDYERKPSIHVYNFLPISAKGWKKMNDDEPNLFDFIGFNWAAHKKSLTRLGGFDKKFGPNSITGAVGQEHNMMLRLYDNNVKPLYVKDALVWHYVPKERSTLKWALKRKKKVGISEGVRNRDRYTIGEVQKSLISEYFTFAKFLFCMSRSNAINSLFKIQYYRGIYYSIVSFHK